MSLQSCREQVATGVDDYVKTFGARKEIKTTGEILELLRNKGLELDPMFLVSDMCYNKTNKANRTCSGIVAPKGNRICF